MMRLIPAMLALAAALALSSPVTAAVEESGQVPAAAPAPGPDDQELSAFVAAFVRLIGIQHGYLMLMRDEEDPARLEEIKQNAMTDMKSAVERDGLSVDRYNQIAVSVREDPSLRDRVEGLLQQMAADPSDPPPAPDEE